MVTLKAAPEKVIKPWLLPQQKTYHFINARVVDPVTGSVTVVGTVTTSDGVIQSMSQSNYNRTSIGDGSITVDLEGKYLCPGLIDCHVHLATVPGAANLKDTMTFSGPVSLLRQTFVAEQILNKGFTTVRDCGGAGLPLKEAIEDGVIVGPRMFISVYGISQTGGHGDRRTPYDEPNICSCSGHSVGKVVDGVDDCLKAAREVLRTGADFIKIMCSGGVASQTDKLKSTQYTAEEIRAFTTVAKNSGTYVTAHAYTPASIKQAIENGVSGIEHGNLIDKETAELMASKGVFLTPTLVTYSTMASKEFADFLPPALAEKNKEILRAGLASVKIAADAGVTMCYGTDLLGPLMKNQTAEFSLRSQVLSPVSILQSATINAAKMIGQEEFLGQIQPGFAADILILNKNPLDDIEIFDQPDAHLLSVIKDGRVYSSRWSKLQVDIRPEVKNIE